MKGFENIIVRASWIDPQGMLLWGETTRGHLLDIVTFKHHLFAWDEASLYGTFMESMSYQRREGVLLSPMTALRFFSNPSVNPIIQVTWDKHTTKLTKWAPLLQQALMQDKIVPDFSTWKEGTFAWKVWSIEHTEEWERDIPYLYAWLEQLVIERKGPLMIQQLKDRWKQLQDNIAEFNDPHAMDKVWRNEGDWLTALGWIEDPRPFRVCLQLIEPLQDEQWTLAVVLQDQQDESLVVSCDSLGEPYIDQAIPTHWNMREMNVINDIEKWIQILPWLQNEDENQLLRTKIQEQEAWNFLTKGSQRLLEWGCSVLLPTWWEQMQRKKPRLKAKVKSAGSTTQTMLGLHQLVEFDWKIAVGDTEISEEQFLQMVEQKKRFIQHRGNWIALDPSFIKKVETAMKKAEKNNGLTLRDILSMHLRGNALNEEMEEIEENTTSSMELEVELNEHLAKLVSQLHSVTSIPHIPPPETFHGTLRKYQIEGHSWMLFLRQFGLGGCLADDMGLGKTIQWITYLLYVKEQEHPNTPSLLICPTSVLGNWKMELERFAPSLNVHLHYGSKRTKGEHFHEEVKAVDLVITSYTLAHLDEEELTSFRWNSICLDEAQNIKNAYTKQATSIRKLDAHHRIAMTGTPIENRLTELWSIFDFINPDYLGSLHAFKKQFVHAVETKKDTKQINQVKQLVQPFLLRRIKKDPSIELDLPNKFESKEYVSLSVEQGTLYDSIIRTVFDKIDQVSSMKRRGLILSTLVRLKQICNHPALLLKDYHGGGRDHRSNKLERLIEMVKEIRAENERCLIFTQFIDMGHILQSQLQRELGESISFLYGGTPKNQRDEMIMQFQNQEDQEKQRGVFILSLKAGGIGLNLTAANHVFHYDRWWNPAVENQATDRAFRIGQTKHVQVHKFVTLGTLEERIDKMLEHKQGLSEHIVSKSEQWITELSTSELRKLFTLQRDWVHS